MRVLGISAFYHDSAAALIEDGHLVGAAQEERFTRKKHDSGFPQHAVQYCLDEAGIKLQDVDYVAFYDKPFLKFERLLETYLAFAPRGFASFRQALPRFGIQAIAGLVTPKVGEISLGGDVLYRQGWPPCRGWTVRWCPEGSRGNRCRASTDREGRARP
jgi:predicted NodU family carbamoyl transferase